MTPEQRVTVYLLALVTVWAAYQAALRLLRCPYCGGIASHDDHCPYGILK